MTSSLRLPIVTLLMSAVYCFVWLCNFSWLFNIKNGATLDSFFLCGNMTLTFTITSDYHVLTNLGNNPSTLHCPGTWSSWHGTLLYWRHAQHSKPFFLTPNISACSVNFPLCFSSHSIITVPVSVYLWLLCSLWIHRSCLSSIIPLLSGRTWGGALLLLCQCPICVCVCPEHYVGDCPWHKGVHTSHTFSLILNLERPGSTLLALVLPKTGDSQKIPLPLSPVLPSTVEIPI